MEAGLIHSVREIYSYIPIASTYKNIHVSYSKLQQLIENTREMKLCCLVDMAKYFDLDPRLIIGIAYVQAVEDSALINNEKVVVLPAVVALPPDWNARMLDKRRVAVRLLLEAGSILSFADIFMHISPSHLYKKFSISQYTLAGFVSKPGEMKLHNLITISDYFEVDPYIVIWLAYEQFKKPTREKQ